MILSRRVKRDAHSINGAVVDEAGSLRISFNTSKLEEVEMVFDHVTTLGIHEAISAWKKKQEAE